MATPTQLAKQFREVYLDGDWIARTNLKQELDGLDWKTATTPVGNLNTIALLAFHLNYYIGGVLQVIGGGPLDIKDKYSFDAPPIEGEEDWQTLLTSLWENAEQFADRLELMSKEQLGVPFVKEEYGSYERNILAMIEHGYYHLGQIVIIKKLL